jgi:DnaJ-class molecular chaperone
MKNYYDILNINSNASNSEIKRSFRKLARKHHPDFNGDAEKFKEINEAYNTLSNSNKKHRYDSGDTEKEKQQQEARRRAYQERTSPNIRKPKPSSFKKRSFRKMEEDYDSVSSSSGTLCSYGYNLESLDFGRRTPLQELISQGVKQQINEDTHKYPPAFVVITEKESYAGCTKTIQFKYTRKKNNKLINELFDIDVMIEPNIYNGHNEIIETKYGKAFLTIYIEG